MILRSNKSNDLMLEWDNCHPKVSVVMSCFNSSSWLSQSIESVLCQSMRDFEFIIVDDGSTDGSWEIIKSYSHSDERIKPILKENSGLADSLNLGVAKSVGHWIARIDSDDIWNSQKLSHQLNALARINRCVYMGSSYTEFYDDIGCVKIVSPPCEHKQLIKNMLTGRRIPAHSSALISRFAFYKAGGYRACFFRSEDLDLWLRIGDIGELRSLTEPLVAVRLHKDQMSKSDGGIPQLKYSLIAACFYWLRLWGVEEPNNESTSDKQNFHQWVDRWMESNSVILADEYKIKLQSALKNRSPSRLLKFLSHSIKNPHLVVMLFMGRMPYMASPRKMASDWIYSK